MTNQEQLFIVKEAFGLARGVGKGIHKVIGSRGTTGITRYRSPLFPGARPVGSFAESVPGKSLWGAKGFKGLSRPALTQLSGRPAFHSVGQGGIPSTSMQQAGNNMVATPLANLLKVLGVGGAGGAIGYGMKKGLDADDAIDPTYSPKKKPNKNTGARLKNQLN